MKQGKCGICGNDVEYVNAEFNEGVVELDVLCSKCGAAAKEIFTTKYLKTEIDVEAEKDFLDNEIAQTVLKKQNDTANKVFYDRELEELYRRRAYQF